MTDADPVIVIVGPTASGKTDLAQQVALAVDGEVVSADSMQVYRGMDIGTGKLPVEERLVAHHGFDLVDPGEPFSAALFQAYARECFTDISSRGKRPLLCGGTGFYVRAAIDGTSYAAQKERLASIPQVVPAIFIGLAVDPDRLRARIDARVDAMFEQGLVREVESLLNAGFRDGITAPQAIGYKEVVAALDGSITFDEAREKIKIATHRYAKRQRTWFRKDERIVWIDANEGDLDALTERALTIVRNAS